MAEFSDKLRNMLDDLLGDEPEVDLGAPVDPESPHLPVVILIDASTSMNSEVDGIANITRVNQALREFIGNIETGLDEVHIRIRECGDFCILSYGGETVDLVLPWTHGSHLNASAIPEIVANGQTPMHSAIIEAGNMLLQRLRGYKRDDIEAYCGAVFNLTDGEPTDHGDQRHARAVIEMFERGTSKGIPLAEFHHVGVPGFKVAPLESISPGEARIHDIGSNIADFFRYITITFSAIAGDRVDVVEQADWRAQHASS